MGRGRVERPCELSDNVTGGLLYRKSIDNKRLKNKRKRNTFSPDKRGRVDGFANVIGFLSHAVAALPHLFY